MTQIQKPEQSGKAEGLPESDQLMVQLDTKIDAMTANLKELAASLSNAASRLTNLVSLKEAKEERNAPR